MNLSLESLVPYLAGAVGIPVVNWLKEQLGASGKAAVLIAYAVSLVLAIVALALAGELSGVDLLEDSAKAFAAATLVYKLLG